MKGFLVFTIFAIANGFTNKELRLRNSMIRERLRTFGDGTFEGDQDFNRNKEIISEFVKAANDTRDLITKYELFLGIRYYLNEILEGFEGNVEIEGVFKSQVQEVIQIIDLHMKDFNLLLFSRETFIKFQEIQGISSQRQQEIIKLYLENSEITAKLSKSQGMLSETSTKLSNALEKIVYYEKELNSAISNYQSHVENIEKAIQLESKFTSIKEKDTFKDIQVSQDQVISRLQQESELSSLTLQQISAEIVELDGKIKIFNSKASRLERELLSKGLDLMKSENKFEDFRVKVEENTKFDLSRLKNMESNHLEDITKLEKELELNKDELHVCQGQIEINQLNNRKIRNLINDLQENLEENQLKVQNVHNANKLEVLQVQQEINDCLEQIREVGVRKEEEENRIKQQDKTIEQLNYEISEAEYYVKIKSGQDWLVIQ